MANAAPGASRNAAIRSSLAELGISIWCLVDLAVGTHEPAFVREGLAGEPVGQPIGNENRREWAQICGGHVADRMAGLLIHHHLLRTLDRAHEALGMLDRAELLAFTGDHEI